MADGWSELLRELGVHRKREPRNRYVCSDDRSTSLCLTLTYD